MPAITIVHYGVREMRAYPVHPCTAYALVSPLALVQQEPIAQKDDVSDKANFNIVSLSCCDQDLLRNRPFCHNQAFVYGGFFSRVVKNCYVILYNIQ